MRLASFDIFDTVLTRTVAVPRDLFRVLAERLQARKTITQEPAAFAAARRRAETAARSQRPDGEITLAEIYDELARALDWPATTREAVEAAEMETEADCLRAVPAMKARVAAVRRTGDRIVFLSDMYLPSSFLEKILRREGMFQDGDTVYVSGEQKASKAAGTLYAQLRQTLPPDTDWQHVGDNRHADCLMARAQQVQAEEFSDAHLTRYEQLARGTEEIASTWRSHLAGAMRLARLANPETDPHRRAIWESGTQIVGPLLLGFVNWCLTDAQARGIRRLYFVARDGQIMHQLAEQIVRATGMNIECRYLYGSRQAWHTAAIDRFGPDDFEWLLPHTKQLSIDQIFRRLGFSPGDFSDLLSAAGFAPSTWDEPLRGHPKELAGLLLHPRLVAAIEAAARARRTVALRYLAQEGLLDDAPFAIVDIGWYGNLQKSLTRLLSLSSQPASTRLTGYYFGLHQTPRLAVGQTMSGYLNGDEELMRHFTRQNCVIFELFTAADHGSVLGYAETDGVSRPVLAAEPNERALTWGLAVLQAAVRGFAAQCLENAPAGERPLSDYRFITYQLFRLFYEEPSAVEARTWGSFPFSEEQYEQNFHQLVPDWSSWETLRAVVDHRRRPVDWWLAGAQAAHPNLPLWAYIQVRRLKAALSAEKRRPL